MSLPYREFLLASGITLALSVASPAFAAENTPRDIINARQESQIWTTFALNPYLRASDLAVSVQGGKATLTGKVAEDVSKDLAAQIALGVDGIQSVDNRIIVQTDYVPPPPAASNRSYGEVIDDATITSAIKSKLMWNRYTSGLAINVDSKRGKVTLTGNAESPVAKELAGRMAMNTRGVTSVKNQLSTRVTKPTATESAKRATREAATDVADSWITAKVRSTLLYSSNIDSGDIAVSTRQGVVELSGKVDSGAERALAIELAKNVKGVRSVQSKRLTF